MGKAGRHILVIIASVLLVVAFVGMPACGKAKLAATTTTVTSLPNPSIYGDAVTFTAAVSVTSGTPTGTVTFKDNSTTLGTASVNSGQATYTTSTLSVGNHSITAVYSGDAKFAASTSTSLIQTVNLPLSITTSLPDGNVDVDYLGYLDVSNGTTPYTWSIISGNLPPGLSLDYYDYWGEIYGTPTSVGTYNFTVRVVDGASVTNTASLSVSISAAPVIETTGLPDGNVNVAYSETLDAAGGTTPYTWSIISGSLPPGLSLNATSGDISGTPTTANTFNFTVRLTDNVAGTDTASLSISISGGPAITTTGLPEGEVDIAYSATVNATGGTTPYTWSITSGNLTPGLSLNTTSGAITGTPTADGSYYFTVQVSGYDGATSKQWLDLYIGGAPGITTTSLPNGNVNVYYWEYLDVSGGIAPYTWSLISGNLPPGLSVHNYDNSGEICGTPTSVGTYNFTVQVVDGAGVIKTASLSISISAAPVIETTGLPDGNGNVAYSETLDAAGGTTPYTWSIISGSLPPGLSLNATSGDISGTPNTANTFNFTVQLTDNVAGTDTASLSIRISGAPAITTTGLPEGEVGIAYSTTVNGTGGTTPYTWSITSGNLPPGLSLNTTSGAITGTPTAKGTYYFTVQVSGYNGATSKQSLNLHISKAPHITTTSLPDGSVSVDYWEYLDVSGGITPYTWSLISGNLPPGLSLDDYWGEIYGTPTTVGTYNFTVRVVDGAGVIKTASLSISIS